MLQENREREAAERRIKQKESMRTAAKRHSTVSSSGPEPSNDHLCLESALHNLLTKAPGGLVRSKKTIQPCVEGTVSERRSQKPVTTTSCTSRGSPEKKHPKLLREDKQMEKMVDKEVEKMCEITRKVLQYQNGKNFPDGDSSSNSPCGLDTEGNCRIPSTPPSRDYYFSSDGNIGSPWTILSPVTSSHRNRQPRSGKTSSTSSEDGVWETDENSSPLNTCSPESLLSPAGGPASLPECLRLRALSKPPLLRSGSVDETSQSATGFRLEYLFQRSGSQRSNSSGSRTASMKEGGAHSKVGSQAEGKFISFFKRIGSKSKLSDLEEQNFRWSYTRWDRGQALSMFLCF